MDCVSKLFIEIQIKLGNDNW